jgi:1-acyl-sn-glycerol-3-phosphate acyltransferase
VIPARRSRAFTWWFARDAESRVRSRFSALRVSGLDRVRRALDEGPVLVVSNHTSYWDALLVLTLGVRVLRAETFAMMDAANLRRLPFFALVGAFGVDRTSVIDGARSVRYAAKLLEGRGRLVWIFAQGREAPVTTRPLGFHGGSAAIARIAPRARVVPIALRYEHGELPDAAVWVSAGDAVDADHERAVLAQLDAIERALAGADAEFETIFSRGQGAWMRALETMLAAMTRPIALPRGQQAPVARDP